MLTDSVIILLGLHPEVWAAQHLVRCDWPGHPGGAGAAVELREELGDRQAPREDRGSPLHDCQTALWRHVPWTPGKLLIWKAPFQFLVGHYLAALFRPSRGILLKATSLVIADSLHFLVKGSQETFRHVRSDLSRQPRESEGNYCKFIIEICNHGGIWTHVIPTRVLTS